MKDYSERVDQLQNANMERDLARDAARLAYMKQEAARYAAAENLRHINEVSMARRPEEPTSSLLRYVHGRKVAEEAVVHGAVALPEDSPFHAPDIDPESLRVLSAAAEARKEDQSKGFLRGGGLLGKGGFLEKVSGPATDILEGASDVLEEAAGTPADIQEGLNTVLRFKGPKSLLKGERAFYTPEEAQREGTPQIDIFGGEGGIKTGVEALNEEQRVYKEFYASLLPEFDVNLPIENLAVGIPGLGQVALANLALQTVQKLTGQNVPELSDLVDLGDTPVTDELVANLMSYVLVPSNIALGLGMGVSTSEKALLAAAKAGDRDAILAIVRNPNLLTKIGNKLRAGVNRLGKFAAQEASGRIYRSVEMTPAETRVRKLIGKQLVQSVDGVPSELHTREELIALAGELGEDAKPFVDDLIEEGRLVWGPESIITTPDGRVGIVAPADMDAEKAAISLTDFVVGRERRLTFTPTEKGGGTFEGFGPGKGGEEIAPEPTFVEGVKLPTAGEVSTELPKRRGPKGQSTAGLPKEAVPVPEPKPAPTVESLQREFDLSVGREAGLSEREVLDNIRAGVFKGEPIDYRVANQLLNELENRGKLSGPSLFWKVPSPRTSQMAAAIRRGYRKEISSSIDKIKDIAKRPEKLKEALEDFADPAAYNTYVDAYVERELTLAARTRGPSPNAATLREEAGWRFMHDQGVPGFEADLEDIKAGVQEIVDNVNPNLSPKASQEARGALESLLYKKGPPTAKEIKTVADSFGPNSSEIVQALVSAKTSLPRKIWYEALDAANASRLIKTIYDDSMVLRQGLIPALSHPELGARAVKQSATAATSEVAAKGIMRDYHLAFESYRYRYVALGGEEAGKAFDEAHYIAPLFETSPDLSSLEEAWLVRHSSLVGRALQKVPGKGASERAAIVSLTSYRDGLESIHLAALEARNKGVTLKEVTNLGHVIQIETGRGTVPGFLKDVTPLLNPIAWSARFFLSRVEPIILMADPRTTLIARRALFRDYGIAYGALAAAVSGASLIPGVSVSTSLNADFAKIKFGDTRVDPWGGFIQFGLLGGRLAEDIYTGDFDGAKNHLETFARSKLAPIPGKVIDVLSGETFLGEPYVFNFGETMSDLFMPLLAQDLRDGFNNVGGGLRGLVRAAEIFPGVFFGTGANTYTKFEDQWLRDYRNVEGKPEKPDLRNNPAHQKFLDDAEKAVKAGDDTYKRLVDSKRKSDNSIKYDEEVSRLESEHLVPVAERILTGDQTAVRAWRTAQEGFFARKDEARKLIFGEFDIDEDSKIGKAVDAYYAIDANNYRDDDGVINVEVYREAQAEALKPVAKIDPAAAEAIRLKEKYVNPDLNAVDERAKTAQAQHKVWETIAPYKYDVTKIQADAALARADEIRLDWYTQTGKVYSRYEALYSLYGVTPADAEDRSAIYIAALLSKSITAPMAISDEGYQFVKNDLTQAENSMIDESPLGRRSLSMLFWYPEVWKKLRPSEISDLLDTFPDLEALVPDDFRAD